MSKRGRKKEVRIGIVGSAGTGKTSLARAVALEFELPLITSKKIVHDILKKDGYDFASGIQVERFLAQSNRQEKIGEWIMNEEEINKRFVTDRPVVDLISYAVAEQHFSDPTNVEKMFSYYMEHARKYYTHLIVCPWENKPIESNGLRTLNHWYQLIIHSLTTGILDNLDIEYHVLKSADNEGRLKEVIDYLKQ